MDIKKSVTKGQCFLVQGAQKLVIAKKVETPFQKSSLVRLPTKITAKLIKKPSDNVIVNGGDSGQQVVRRASQAVALRVSTSTSNVAGAIKVINPVNPAPQRTCVRFAKAIKAPTHQGDSACKSETPSSGSAKGKRIRSTFRIRTPLFILLYIYVYFIIRVLIYSLENGVIMLKQAEDYYHYYGCINNLLIGMDELELG